MKSSKPINELKKHFSSNRDRAAKKFPLGFAIIASFGLITTTNGLQKMLENIPLINNNPWISFVVGLVILIATGTVYKKLG
ncbi:hypothetical protein KC930_03460 [Candidatus Saccharibacteria bacterium]|nr:hypothetical protein [Candidatus Saccharibacteria bacterium]